MASTPILSAPSTSSSSSSSSTHGRKYDLFLSFRGKDTRYEFADTLFTTLKRWGIVVFRDDEGLQRGEEINLALEVAIKESRNAAIIISPDFTKSKACLFELTVIMECWRMQRLSVFPVFYHIDPSDVGKLTKDFKNHFNNLEDDPEDKEAKWEYWKSLLDTIADGSIDPKPDEDPVESGGSALKKLSDISAWVVQENSYINPIIDKICQAIWAKTISDLPNISENLVGIESRAANVMQLLELEKEDEVRVVGICGMGGIGKSTLAKFIYKKVIHHFEAGHFSDPIGKEKDKKYLVSVQKELILNIFSKGAANLLDNAFMIENVFQTKLWERKVLIVLDDLWDNIQVNALVGDIKWFGPGSRIIITSRIQDLLHLSKGNNIYEVEELNKDDALKLFCMKAFKQPQPKEGFEELSKKVVDHAKRHPFALEIFGSYLSNKETKDRWHGYLKDLGTKLEDNIANTLQKSVEELDKGIVSPGQDFPLKELFLDIACFFNGKQKNYVLDILEGVDGFGDNLEHNLSVLVEKSLLKISDDQKLLMHDFLVDMGQQIASSSRLLQLEDIVRVLESPSTENFDVKGIVLKLFSQKKRTFHLEALSAMVNLRVLQISYYHHAHNFDDKMEELDKDLDHDDEVEDRMQHRGIFSRIKWNGILSRIKWIGDLSRIKWNGNLSKIKWNGDLLRIEWIGDLLRFKLSADLRIMEWSCYPLESLPRGSNFVPTKLVVLKLCKGRIKRLWDGKKSFPKLKHIELCFCEELIETPDMSQVPNLEILTLCGCYRLSTVHSSVGGLKRLSKLNLAFCFELEQFPDVISSKCLEDLNFFRCRKLKKFPNIQFSLPVLRDLRICGTQFEEHPSLSAKFPSLKSFELPSCIAFAKKPRELSFSCPTYFRFPTRFSELSSLKSLTLTWCNFSDETELIDFRGLSSLRYLSMLGNKFRKVPDFVGELSSLMTLHLDCSTSLEALSKLPLSLKKLRLIDYLSLEVFDSQMTEQISKEMLRTNRCSFMVAYIGFEGKPYKILYLHPESPPYTSRIVGVYYPYYIKSAAACGPTLEPRITDWFIHRSFSSGKNIQIPMDWNSKSKPWVCALLIVYEVYGHDKRESRKRKLDDLENSDIGGSEDSNRICPEFVCQLQLNERSPEQTFVVCVPEVARVGLHGLWVCINSKSNYYVCSNSSEEPESVERLSCRVSITASNKNVTLKEGGARLLDEDADLELVEVVKRISRRDLDSPSLVPYLDGSLVVWGPITSLM